MSSAAVTIDELLLADAPERWSALGFDRRRWLRPARDRPPAARRRERRPRDPRLVAACDLIDRARRARRASAPIRSRRRRAGTFERRRRDRPHRRDVARARSQCRALQAAGLDLRRIREQPTPAGAPRQAFFRLGEEILEVVQEPEQRRRAWRWRRPSRAALGARAARSRARPHSRSARRPCRRGASGRAGRPADRDDQALRRARRARRADQREALGASRELCRRLLPVRASLHPASRSAPPAHRRGTARARCTSPTGPSSGSSPILPASA